MTAVSLGSTRERDSRLWVYVVERMRHPQPWRMNSARRRFRCRGMPQTASAAPALLLPCGVSPIPPGLSVVFKNYAQLSWSGLVIRGVIQASVGHKSYLFLGGTAFAMDTALQLAANYDELFGKIAMTSKYINFEHPPIA